jgi:putative transposase
MQIRKYTFKLYPSSSQAERLLNIKRVHCDLYNAALQERIDAYRKAGLSIGYAAQCKSVTAIRAADACFASINAASQQVTLKRLDKAFKAFFTRVKSGSTPGFPRFKSFTRFPGWGYKQHGDGFRFHSGEAKHGRLFLSGVGTIRARGRCRVTGSVKACEILHRQGAWYVSLTLSVADTERVCHGTAAMGFDWGVETLLTGKDSDGKVITIDNPRWYRESEQRRTELQQSLARKRRGSARWRRARRQLSRFTAHEARKRHDHHHKLSATLASEYAAVCGEALTISNMTRSAKGTAEQPGSRVAQKAGLNREILDTAPSALYEMISYKVTETGSWFMKAPTRSLKPSQRCPVCWSVARKQLSDRVHECQVCGHKAPRDLASAEVNLTWLEQQLQQVGNPPDKGVALVRNSTLVA